MWTYHLVDTLSGEKLHQVKPAGGGTWGRMISDQGGGSHSFPLSASPLTKAQWKDGTQHWARTLVVSWNGVAKYAGLILHRQYDRKKKTLQVRHKDMRIILGRRFPFGVDEYDRTLVLENKNQSLQGLAAGAVRRALTKEGNPRWTLPVIVPGPSAGSESRTYYAYEFTTAESMLDEVEGLDGGPDVDFEPRWSPTTGRLEWVMRIGSPRLAESPSYEFAMNVDRPGLFDLSDEEDGSQMLTGLLAIGKGSEQDIRIGKGGAGIDGGPLVPFLDSSQSFKELDDIAVLNSHAQGEVRARRYATKQWSASVRTDSIDVAALRLGATFRLRFSGDEWEDDGATDFYLIAYYGDGTQTLTLDLQDPRRI